MKKRTKIFISIIFAISLFFTVLAIIPPKKAISNNPFIIEEGSRPLIAAHRGGKLLNPENTFKAMDYSVNELKVDILEMDLCITSDKHLILNHNDTINSCTDVEVINGSNDKYYIREHTLNELRQFNFGYNFTQDNVTYPYRNLLDNVSEDNRYQVLKENRLSVITIEELFLEYKATNLLYIIEIKDSGDLGYEAADILYQIMKQYDMINRVAIGTFNTEVEEYLIVKYPDTIRGGSVGGVTNFVLTQMLGVNIFDKSSFACLQIPTSRKAFGVEIKLDCKTFINRAHRRNISVQFWTINDKEEMKRLIELGADVIMTDCPDVMVELLNEMEL
mgnify:CR=1 FL=1